MILQCILQCLPACMRLQEVGAHSRVNFFVALVLANVQFFIAMEW